MADPTTLTVTGRFLNVTGDGADGSAEPDANPLKGTVTLESLLPYSAATGSSTVFGALLDPVHCTFDSNGDLVRQGTAGAVKVYDLTDPSLSPHIGEDEFTHIVSLDNISDATTGAKLGSWKAMVRIAADNTTSAGTVHLPTRMTPLDTSAPSSIVYVEGQPGDTGAQGPQGDIGDAIDLGNKTGALDLSSYTLASQTFRLTATGNLTLAPAGMPVVPAGKSGTCSLRITQGSGGSKTLTFDAAIKTAYGVDPVLSTAAGAVDVLHMFYDGVQWVALMAAQAIA